MIIVLCGAPFCSDRTIYLLSRIYEGLFFCFQYEYAKMNDQEYNCLATYGEKIVCLIRNDSAKLRELLVGKEIENIVILSERKNRKVFATSFNGREYLVKRHVQNGWLINLLQMGRSVSIWNNLHWAKDKGLSVVEPVAFSERRQGKKVVTTIIYRYEGERSDHFMKAWVEPKISPIVAQLRKMKVIHADLRHRNMIYTKESDAIKMIDVDLMHYYNVNSYACINRLNREERWLQED